MRRTNALQGFYYCILMALVVAVTGCRRPYDKPGVIRITIWTMWIGHEEQNFKRVLARYHQLHPNIVFNDLGGVGDDTQTIRAIVAGVPPDIFTLSDPSYLGPLAAEGALMPMDRWFRRSHLNASDFIPAGIAQCRYNGKLYAMPYLLDDYALLWNKTLFAKAGLPVRPPKTLSELERDAIMLTRRDSHGNLIQLGLKPLDDPFILCKDFGGRFYDPAHHRITADCAGNLEAYRWYANLIKRLGGEDQVDGFARGFGQDQGPGNPFFTNKVAMMVNGEWNPYWTYRYAPQLKYGVAPFPYPDHMPQMARTTFFGGNLFCIPRGSRHPRQAWKFLVWAQSREAQVLFAGMMNNVPNIRSVLKAPELRHGAPYKREYSKYLDLADSPNGHEFPVLPVTSLYRNQLITAMDFVLYGRKTPQKALADVQKRVQRELDRWQ